MYFEYFVEIVLKMYRRNIIYTFINKESWSWNICSCLRTCSLSNIGVENAILLLKVMTLTTFF